MEKEFVITSDGSSTIYLKEWDEHYHSKHGAIQESKHVFIKNGLYHFIDKHPKKPLSILEIGFGTGLNAFLTLLEAEALSLQISYHSIEAYPLSLQEIGILNYTEMISVPENLYKKMHEVSWEKYHDITSHFRIKKRKQFFETIDDAGDFDIIYFDAFGPRVQPDLWNKELFVKMHNALKKQGILVTYCAKGSVRRTLQEIGFTVEKLVGPPGKREMLRGTKVD